jgi:hypothetical protein
MKILNTEQYINEKLDIKPIVNDDRRLYLRIGSFIKDNNLVFNDRTQRYDCDGDVKVDKCIVEDGKLQIKFGVVNGDFNCSGMGLVSLEGCPQYVGHHCFCFDNQLTSLKGSPKEVGWNFCCSNNDLQTLEGCPQKVGGDFDCKANDLRNINQHPKEVGGDFRCENNPNLVLSKYKPNWIRGYILYY